MGKQTRQIFSTQAANGRGNIIKTIESDPNDTETVVIQVTGTWSGVTVNPQISLDYGINSPATWSNVQTVASDGTLADVAITADAVISLRIPNGVHFSLNVTGAGSPIPSLNAFAHGDVEAAA